LGLAKPTLSKESMFDARLFNQSEGLDSGFKDDEGKVHFNILIICFNSISILNIFIF